MPNCQQQQQQGPNGNKILKVCRAATKLANKVSNDIESYSRIIKPWSKQEENIPRLGSDEVVLGELLGSGGYNNVYELYGLDIDYNNDDDDCDNKANNIERQKRHQIAKDAADGKYAIKFLREKLLDDPTAYCNGAADLVVETTILSHLTPHRNIIQLHGVSADGIQGFASGDEGGYFLVIDRLSDTLANRIKSWKQQEDYQSTFVERLQAAAELSAALSHLHKNNIVYRDLKPDNVGFGMDGEVKLFDFGLAKELDERQKVSGSNDTYKMSGGTGSVRYMSPEVTLHQPYNLSADVYSFGLLLWQILTLEEEPYQGMTMKDHLEFVCRKGQRPLTTTTYDSSSLCSQQLRNIMNWSWHQDAKCRPPMKEIYRALKTEIKKLQTVEPITTTICNKKTQTDSKDNKSDHNNDSNTITLENVFIHLRVSSLLSLNQVSTTKNIEQQRPTDVKPLRAPAC